MPIYRNDERFIEAIVPSDLLEQAISWIKSNLNPDDVFDEDQLKDWALDQDVDDVCDIDELQSWAKNQSVEDVCDITDLERWAENNGYVKED
jgi:hypothetical protein